MVEQILIDEAIEFLTAEPMDEEIHPDPVALARLKFLESLEISSCCRGEEETCACQ